MKTLTVRCSIEIFGQNRIKKNSPRKFGHEYNLRVKNQNFGKNYIYFLSKKQIFKTLFQEKNKYCFWINFCMWIFCNIYFL